jgi:nudix-type nucleoside diphosphatase (YffH/AdpP family)
VKNKGIKIIKSEILSDNWGVLKEVTFDYRKADGSWENHTREAYDNGNGAAILLYNKEKHTVILTRQFRLPTYINGNETGLSIEVCAGLLDGDNPEDCIIREAEEEAGYRIPEVKKVFEAYMTPGSVTEKLTFFIAEYHSHMKVHEGGGLEEEQEHIEVLELDFDEAFERIHTGEIRDAKTILLLQYAKIHGLV